MSLTTAFEELDAFIAGYQQAMKKAPPTRVALLIICPDCGKNPPFRNRCPKCGGDSWIPAGPVSGIFEWVKARQWRSILGPPPQPGETAPRSEPDGTSEPDRRKARRQRRRRGR
jgi:hypothetical protein